MISPYRAAQEGLELIANQPFSKNIQRSFHPYGPIDGYTLGLARHRREPDQFRVVWRLRLKVASSESSDGPGSRDLLGGKQSSRQSERLWSITSTVLQRVRNICRRHGTLELPELC